jgi:CRP/FNR family transcriptional regulator
MSEEQKQRYLARIAIFADLRQTELAELVPQMALRSYPPGQIIFMPQKRLTTVFLLFEGRVHLTRLTEDGKKLVITALKPGDLFGEKVLFGEGEPTLFAEAITATVAGILPRGLLHRLMCEYPHVAIRFAETLTGRLAQLETSLVEMTFEPLSVRLAYILLRNAQKNGAGEEVKGFTHGDLGDLLGTYRETITEALGQFRAQGLIATSTRRITLLDRRGLEELAGRLPAGHGANSSVCSR